jgi:hypothetical protein
MLSQVNNEVFHSLCNDIINLSQKYLTTIETDGVLNVMKRPTHDQKSKCYSSTTLIIILQVSKGFK